MLLVVLPVVVIVVDIVVIVIAVFVILVMFITVANSRCWLMVVVGYWLWLLLFVV